MSNVKLNQLDQELDKEGRRLAPPYPIVMSENYYQLCDLLGISLISLILNWYFRNFPHPITCIHTDRQIFLTERKSLQTYLS